MFTLNRIAVFISIQTFASAALAQTPQFGQPIAPADIAAWDISIGPDGAGLPPGRGTAIEGEAIYVAKCQACHGEKGTKPSDALAGALVGGMGTLAPDKTPIKTVGSFWPYATTLFDYVRRAMPFQESKSLTTDELYAVSAYILNLNAIVGSNDVIDSQSLPKVRMPNRDGFYSVPAQSEITSGPDLGLDLAAAAGVDELLDRFGDDGVAVVVEPVDQGTDRKVIPISGDLSTTGMRRPPFALRPRRRQESSRDRIMGHRALVWCAALATRLMLLFAS
jgi:cytochrome c